LVKSRYAKAVDLGVLTLIKYLVNGHAAPVWFSRPINLSSSLAVTFLLESIPFRSSIQQWNFFFGSAKVSSLVLMLHPRTMNTSDSLSSSVNLSNDRQSLHCSFSDGSSGRNEIWIANNRAWTPLFLLSFMSGIITIPSSIKSSIRPMSSSGIWTSKSAAGVNGMSSFKY